MEKGWILVTQVAVDSSYAEIRISTEYPIFRFKFRAKGVPQYKTVFQVIGSAKEFTSLDQAIKRCANGERDEPLKKVRTRRKQYEVAR